jgi:hypothetical protein
MLAIGARDESFIPSFFYRFIHSQLIPAAGAKKGNSEQGQKRLEGELYIDSTFKVERAAP